MELDPKYADRVHTDATDAAAPEDGPEGHGRRAGPRHRRPAGRRSRTATPCPSPTRCRTSTSTRSSPCWTATRATYLQMLLNGAGDAASTGNGGDLAQVFRRFEPTARDMREDLHAAASSAARTSSARSTTSASSPRRSPRKRPASSPTLVDSSNERLPALRQPGREPPADGRRAARRAEGDEQSAGQAKAFADELRPGAQSAAARRRRARPDARETRPFLRETTPIIENQLRPFTRARAAGASSSCGRPPPSLAGRDAGPHDDVHGAEHAAQRARLQPARQPSEGYLFWAAWLNHIANSIFSAQDAEGPIRRGAARPRRCAVHRRSQRLSRSPARTRRRWTLFVCWRSLVEHTDTTRPTTTGRLLRRRARLGRLSHAEAGTDPRTPARHGGASRCPASGCCCSCGWPSAAASRSSRRATASTSASARRRSWPSRPTCASPACRSARS